MTIIVDLPLVLPQADAVLVTSRQFVVEELAVMFSLPVAALSEPEVTAGPEIKKGSTP